MARVIIVLEFEESGKDEITEDQVFCYLNELMAEDELDYKMED